jgi:hypothetical protein
VGREEILQAAMEAVTKRNLTYGEPEDSFSAIAELWLAWLKIRKTQDLGVVDVAIMMMLMKIGRLAGNGGNHIDTWIDIAGYAACAGELATTEKKENGK